MSTESGENGVGRLNNTLLTGTPLTEEERLRLEVAEWKRAQSAMNQSRLLDSHTPLPNEEELLNSTETAQMKAIAKIQRHLDRGEVARVDPSFRPATTLRQLSQQFRKRPYGHMITSVIFQASQGLSARDISRFHKMPIATVKEWLALPEVNEKVVALQSRNTLLSPEARLKGLVPQAMDTIQALMKRADRDSTRLAAAQTVLEYTLSKPKQEISVESKSSLREVLEMLKAEEKQKEQKRFEGATDAEVMESEPVLPLTTEQWLKQKRS